jgi:Protein O-mannosyl-transferase TMEM260-like
MSEPRLCVADEGPPLFRGWVVLFAVTFLLYAFTANRSAQWQDSGNIILRVVTGEVANPLGLALSHPLHFWLCKLFAATLPLEPAFAVTLVSSFAAAIAVANVFGCSVCLTGNRGVALWAALSLAVANVFWQLATIAETYTLAAALLSAECLCLVAFVKKKRPTLLVCVLLFNGLGIANHMLASLTAPAIGVLLVIALKNRWVTWRTLAVGACAWFVGASPYLYLIVEQAVQTGDLANTMHSALFGNAFADSVLNVVPPVRSLAISSAFMALSFPSLLLPAAIYGAWHGESVGVPRVVRLILLGSLVMLLLFAARYNVVDQHIFFLPSYILLTIFGSVGAAVYLKRPKAHIVRTLGIVLLAGTPLVSALAPVVAGRSEALRSMVHRKPYRNDFVYLLTPWSVVKDSAERMSRQAVELAGDNGLIVVEDSMAIYALRYTAMMEARDDIKVTVDAALISEAVETGRRVVLVPFDRDHPKTPTTGGEWQRVGDLYELRTVAHP